MNSALRAVVLLAVLAATFAGPAVEADQGKSGDSTDWGCGGHPRTAAELWTNGTHETKGMLHSDQGAWRNWWYLNRPTLLDVSYRVAPPVPNPPAFEKWREDVRAALREALDSPTVPLASEAALGLGRGGDVRDTEILVKVAGDTHREQNVRRRATLALGLLPVDAATAKPARETLFDVLRESIGNNDDRLELWGFAACALGLRGDVTAAPRLADFIARHRDRTDADHVHGVHREVMGAATAALGLFRDPVLLPNLVVALTGPEGEGNLHQRRTMMAVFAAYGLARIGDPAALPALRESVGDDRSDVRRAALLALGAFADPNDADTIALLAGVLAADKDDVARGMAAIALGRSGAASAPAALRAAYADGTSAVRCFVALALGLYSRRKADRDVNAFLLSELNASHNTNETGALAIANGLAVHFASAPRLVEIASTPGEVEMRSHAAFALGLLSAEGIAPEVLLDLVVHGQPVLRHEAGLALGLARRRDGIDALIGVVGKDNSLPERGSAAVVLGRIAGSEAAPVLMKILRDEHELNALRICAAHGLGLLLDRNEGRKLGILGADVNWINEVNKVWLPTEVLDQLLSIMD